MSIGLLGVCVVLLVATMGISSVFGFFATSADQARLREDRYLTRDIRIYQQALTDAETGVRGYALTGRREYLDPYFAGIRVIDDRAAAVVDRIDAFLAGRPGAVAGSRPASATLRALRTAWRAAIERADEHRLDEAQDILVSQPTAPLMDDQRRMIAAYLTDRNAIADQTDQRIAWEQTLLLIINPAAALVALLATGFAFWRGAGETRARTAAGREMRLLFDMTDMLQSASDRDDANEVLRVTALRLLPDCSGALYVFSNSRDRLDLSTQWGDAADLPDHIQPDSCWALKRGKPHLNHDEAGPVCRHAMPDQTVLEIPMAARGELYGLLQISSSRPDAAASLVARQHIAVALSDAMSLSLSSNALRDKLRNQALRDGLTGLYNRRFLEEMLERITQDAQRRDIPVSAIMIDLDHFKRLNDQFGHAAGDAALQDVSRAILSNLRSTDVACRYGGEELLVLLPDCSQERAMDKAEQLRAAIKEAGGATAAQGVTASLGVASIPFSAAHGGDLLVAADAALYRAKQEGRDRVVGAPARARVSLVTRDVVGED